MGNGKKRNTHQKHPNRWQQKGPKKFNNRSRILHKGDDTSPLHLKKEFVEKNSLSEEQVGITEFVSNVPGFIGIIKARFADFHVNEIDLTGKVLRLTDLTVPKGKDDSLGDSEVASIREELNDVINADDWVLIETLANSKTAEGLADNIQINVSELSKDRRTLVHKLLKKLYNNRLVSTTVTDEATNENETEARRFVKISRSGTAKKGDRSNKQWAFDKDYVHFLVHKENMDTSEVTSAIAGRLGLRASQVVFCGTKDKRGKTTQRMCIKRRSPSDILRAIKSQRQLHAGNFELSDEVLKLGQLRGNRFRIALRQVNEADRTTIEDAVKTIRTSGFINYFGMQRFGNCASIPTFEVGVALLKSNYKLACELIMKPRSNDPSFVQAIREQWWRDRNSAEAMALFRSGGNEKFLEFLLLRGLAEFGENDYSSALRRIPRNTLLLYTHAFQSLVFNRVVSRRIRDLGQKLIVGDLIYRSPDEQDDPVESGVDVENVEEIETTTKDENEMENEEKLDENTTEESTFKRKVRPLTEEDVASGQYTLFDVVLPLPGYDIKYPANEVAGWYEEIMQEYGLSSTLLRHRVKTYSLAGTYRRIMVRPEEMKWQFRRYDANETTLIASDWETVRPALINLGGGVVSDSNKLPPYDIDMDTSSPSSEGIGKNTALLLDFRLPTAVYATMMLRELLKADTSAKNQIALQQTNSNSVQSAGVEKRKLSEAISGEKDENENKSTENDSSSAKIKKLSETEETVE